MPRHNRRRVAGEPVLRSAAASVRREEWRGAEYLVRSVPASSALKTYRCPGCDHEVRPGVPHVVVWAWAESDAADRRHWHTGCWSGRDRRSPTRRW